jgi:phage tail-like protein
MPVRTNEELTGLGLRFKVTIDGYGSLGNWTKCEGLSVEFEIHEYKEGGLNDYVHRLPGRAKYKNIKLTRPIDGDSPAVADWLASVKPSQSRQTAQIAVLDAEGETVSEWNLQGVFPARWTGPSLDASSSTVAIEQLELAHNGFMGGG